MVDEDGGLNFSRFSKRSNPLLSGQPREKDILVDMSKERGLSPKNFQSFGGVNEGDQTIDINTNPNHRSS